MGKFYNLGLSPRAVGGGGHVIPKGIVIGSFNYDEKNVYLKILIRRFLGEKERGRGPSCPPIFRSLKKNTRTFNFRSNQLSSNILGPLDRYDHPWRKQKKKKKQ